MLRDLEREKFIPILQSLTETMLKATQDQYQALKGSALEDPALRNVAFFGVAARLLGQPGDIPPEAQDMVDTELALIETRRALLLVQALRGSTAADGAPAVQLWQNIYEPMESGWPSWLSRM